MKRIVLALCFLVLTTQGQEGIKRGGGPPHDAITRPDTELVMLYDSLSELSTDDQRLQMWGLSSKTKAALWKYNIEQYLQKHRDLGQEEREVLLNGIRMITSPAWFDIEEGSFGYEARSQALVEYKRAAQTLFPPDAIYEIFLRLGEEPIATLGIEPLPSRNPSLSSRRNFAPRVNQQACSCASYFECWYYGADCFGDSYCSQTRHCGWFNTEMCIGVCKLI